MGLKGNWVKTRMLMDLWDDPKYNPEEDPLLAIAVVAIAEAVCPLSAGDEPDRYTQFVTHPGSLDDAAMVRGMRTMSGCALTALALWRCLGIKDQTIWAAYRTSKAVSDVVSVAKAHKAWTSKIPTDVPPFAIGDCVLIASEEHVIVVLSNPVRPGTAPGRWRFNTMQGGHADKKGKQLIEICETEATWTRNGLKIGTRTVVGLARTRLMRPKLEATLPDAWLDSAP